MPVDNQMYDRLKDTWWSDDGWLHILKSGLNPARFGYMRRVLVDDLGKDPHGQRALDVGCGGGLLAEEFARLGCHVTGVDPSEGSLETARAHGRESGLEIEYVHGFGESLPFDDASFDVVYCCDVLEHVDDLDKTIADAARVLRPGGVYLFDTINRTPVSKLVAIKVMQDWEATRMVDPGLHDWNMFIKPRELRERLERNGLEQRDLVGLKPAANPVSLLRSIRAHKRGEISAGELGRRMVFRESRDRSASYAGYAVKR